MQDKDDINAMLLTLLGSEALQREAERMRGLPAKHLLTLLEKASLNGGHLSGSS